jgi:hypothetical protein
MGNGEEFRGEGEVKEPYLRGWEGEGNEDKKCAH